VARTVLGVEKLLADPPAWLKRGARVGLLLHPASVDRELRPTVERFLAAFPGRIEALFGPQHGLWGEKQDNMVESPHEDVTPWGVPCYSLYGESRVPTEEMLSRIDVLVVDLQDVGCRVYTFLATLLGCMEACAEAQVRVVVTDRPNPIGGVEVEGNLLLPSMTSFVGPHPLPMRHGMTLGELALLMRSERGLDVELEVITMRGWRRRLFFGETGLPWVPPSPNIPIAESCWVYPGQVLLEGTNLSEGRGTTRPFEVFGAPFIDPFFLRERLRVAGLPGVTFRAIYFEPTFHKWTGRRCGGLHIHVTDPKAFRPYMTTLCILHEVLKEWGEQVAWREPPYEYERRRSPMDLLTGDPRVRRGLEKGVHPREMERAWLPELEAWSHRRERYLAYSH
jgi:uncharacterized protein YbbC (DUF1343 family)